MSLRPSIGMLGILSSSVGPTFGRVGRVAIRSMGGFSPFFLAALNSAFRRLASSLASALLTVLVTIFIKVLVTLREQ